MLLNELLNKSSNQIRTTKKPVSDLMDTPHHTVVGIGAQTIAYLHKKFPGKIIKTVQITGKDDSIYQFLRLVLKHQDNPYFPKIFSVKMYPTNEINYNVRGDMFDDIDSSEDFSPPPSQLGYTLYIVTEKLTKLDWITYEDITKFGLQKLVLPKSLEGTYKNVNHMKFKYAFKFADYRQHMQQVVQDPKLKQALRLLEPLFRHYEPDMHFNNIMLRGNQWVFIDPVTNPSEDD